MIRKFTLQQKLLGATGTLAVVAILGGLLSAWMISRLGDEMDQAINGAATKLDAVARFSNLVYQIRVAGRNTLVYAFSHKPEIMEEEIRTMQGAEPKLSAAVTEVKQLISSEQEKAAFAQVESTMQAWTANLENVIRLCRTTTAAEAAAASTKNGRVVSQVLEKATAELRAIERQELSEANRRSAVLRSWSRWLVLFSLVLAVAVSVTVLLVVRGVNRQLGQVIHDLERGAEQVAGASSQVSSSSQSLAQGAAEQAASLQQTSASSEEINSMSRRNTENSRVAADLVSSAQQKFIETNQSLEQTVVAMGQIEAQSGRISKIIRTIDEIAFQTNILALNAAVEAARAGEAGLGFAVVADEVRNLAQRSAQAAKDTAELIEETIAKSHIGKTKVDQVAAAIRVITEETGKVRTLVAEVEVGSREESRGIEQIGQAVTQIDLVTQRAVTNAEETAAAAEELNTQSRALKEIVDRLTVMVGGGELATGRIRSRNGVPTPQSSFGKPPREREPSCGRSLVAEAFTAQAKGSRRTRSGSPW